ncbi:hypothetical protein [Halorubrum sp. BV1]|uniref:hypothetical protein n=1 Tax=Halorubrum sp. BV1 TaxID=1498500 RepID=UPI0006790E53|nr:hypothetical protein [Halorubrum sp. BV1]
MSARDDFWESGLPFISNADGRRVDWTDVGLWSFTVVLTSFFSKVADTVATLWNVLVIDRARDISAAYTGFVDSVFSQGLAAQSFSSATGLASDTGLIGAVVIVAAGGYLIALLVGVIRDE